MPNGEGRWESRVHKKCATQNDWKIGIQLGGVPLYGVRETLIQKCR